MARHCDLFVSRTEAGFVVRVQGSGTSAHSPALAEFVRGCFEQQPDACVAIDLLRCDYLDSTFLGCLLRLQRAGTETRFQVVADEVTKKKLLAATQLDSALTLIPEAPKSAGAFQRIEVKPLSDRALGQHIMESHQALADVPSSFASTFGQIATQLKRELERPDRAPISLDDTIG